MIEPSAGDRLLDAWLNLTSVLWNTRIVSSMTYNEAHVLGILHRCPADTSMTATDLICRTHLLKSQMNKLLTSLETKGYILRCRSSQDRRMIDIAITPVGRAAYLEEHKGVEAILNQLIAVIGEEKAVSVTDGINEVSQALESILSGR